MRKTLLAALLALGVGALLSACQDTSRTTGQTQAQAPASEQQQLIEKAKVAVQELRGDPVLGPSVNDYLSRARGVVIFPNLMKAGFFVGAGGGQGVLLVRQGQGWSDPVFVYAADASFGLQIGIEGGPILFAVMTDGALQKLLHGNVNLGGDVSAAVGPVGGGLQGATTPNVGADLVAFAHTQGAYAGISVKGGVIAPRQEWNEAYYGPGATPDQIIRSASSRPANRELKLALSTPPPRRTSSAR
jgi:lipid-binding SYLF domain-containing protein